ncbi:hypothetical protein Ddye_003140 [Dipteronia dyeriana]|uniref:PB1 domain-containing protein n=1 Tax=Dipteronia dyeriana TaxID=168575 RepID=A0AAD9XSC1_9ROSI|nr:hypothetical protein Ddye_003140 [Dipteronia dyeriana]
MRHVLYQLFTLQVPFSVHAEIMKKLTTAPISDGDVVLRYQLVPEELDGLVSIRTDEDLKHMFDEYDFHESQSCERFCSPALQT